MADDDDDDGGGDDDDENGGDVNRVVYGVGGLRARQRPRRGIQKGQGAGSVITILFTLFLPFFSASLLPPPNHEQHPQPGNPIGCSDPPSMYSELALYVDVTLAGHFAPITPLHAAPTGTSTLSMIIGPLRAEIVMRIAGLVQPTYHPRTAYLRCL